jgi:5-methylcytosine-specific restriction endonuclease McrA
MLTQLLESKHEPEYTSISIETFLREYDYSTKYLSRLLKVRPFAIYTLLFKRAYFEEGKRKVTVKLSDLGENLLSDLGQPMSHDVVKRGINDLVQLGIVNKTTSKPGQINEYEVKLPSEIRKVKEMIELDQSDSVDIIEDGRSDYYHDPQKRIEILNRDNYKCFYCLKELQRDNFYLDHIVPQSQGGHNYRSNLVAACKTCNTKKNAQNANDFLRENYRSELLTQTEFSEQKEKLSEMINEYTILTQKNDE